MRWFSVIFRPNEKAVLWAQGGCSGLRRPRGIRGRQRLCEYGSGLAPFQRLKAAAQIAVLRPQRTDVLADRIERMVDSGDEPDQHVHIGAQGAQIVALGHELAAQPIQGYVFGRFGHFLGSPLVWPESATQVE